MRGKREEGKWEKNKGEHEEEEEEKEQKRRNGKGGCWRKKRERGERREL